MIEDSWKELVKWLVIGSISIPFAIWKWVEIIIAFVKWFSSHWS